MEYVFSNIGANSKQKAKITGTAPAPAKVHLLPFKIERDGPARVSAFFDSITQEVKVENPADTNQQVDHLSTSLYGRNLRGVKAEFPENISAHIFSRNATNFERVKFTETSNDCQLFTWNHDDVPSISNNLQANLVYNSLMAELAQE